MSLFCIAMPARTATRRSTVLSPIPSQSQPHPCFVRFPRFLPAVVIPIHCPFPWNALGFHILLLRADNTRSHFTLSTDSLSAIFLDRIFGILGIFDLASSLRLVLSSDDTPGLLVM